MKIHSFLLPALLSLCAATTGGCDYEELDVDETSEELLVAPKLPAQPYCRYSAPFDGGCASQSRASSIVSAAGGELVDWSLCYDANGAAQPGCMLVMARHRAGLFSYRLTDTTCTRLNRGGCYGGYRADYRTRETANGFANGGDTYTVVESEYQKFVALAGWRTILTAHSTTYLEGLGTSSGFTRGYSISAWDADGRELWSGADRTTYLPTGEVLLDCAAYAAYIADLMLMGGNEHFVDCAVGTPYPGIPCEGLNIEAWAQNNAATAYTACLADPDRHLGTHHDQGGPSEPTIPDEEAIMDWDDDPAGCRTYEGPVVNQFDATQDGQAMCCESTYEVKCGELTSGECGCMRMSSTSIVCVVGSC